FIGKAVHIDDAMFIWTAQQIVSHPFDFYGFTMNWYGVDSAMFAVNQNPPGVAYYLALFGSVWGCKEGLRFPVPAWATTMHKLSSLGCYSSYWGMMPFILGRRTEEFYFVHQTQNALDFGDVLSEKTFVISD
ncbi:MAG: hypothetical protein AAF512_11035, partial [Pseudomonadota bacterium]